ncbi:MAG: bifunctional 4-hydroxy-2-oxoglutarate aldolase/2-dehydro-3-deoxy-phosphogluconate aldolase [Hyphomicrobiales bacterium]|nr:bifunctional 4-hydroxy-2-oxoglutarate aldolase/2-dehydro-3-deoxy-phosphogluconate aldolase [Hyphomicrobiales bacterium]
MHSTSENTISLLQPAKLIPLLHLERLEDAVPLAQTLVDCGLPTMEIGLRTKVAAQAITKILDEVPQAVPIAGNVMTVHDLSRAQQAGAKVACSPGAPDDVLDKAARDDIPFVPGIATPTELMAVLRKGFHLAKFFPAVPFGGAGALRAFLAPFPNVKFIPTGGTSEVEYTSWLSLPNVIAVGGSWLSPQEEIERQDWDQIAARARYVVSKYRSLRVEAV